VLDAAALLSNLHYFLVVNALSIFTSCVFIALEAAFDLVDLLAAVVHATRHLYLLIRLEPS